MTDLKRSIAGVGLHVATDEPEKVDRVKKVLDEAMALLKLAGTKQKFERKLNDAMRPFWGGR